jgi:rare lipoprotein A
MVRIAFFATSLVAAIASTAAHAQSKPERGVASWYGTKLNGHLTASGVPMDRQRLTAAHPTLPFGTEVEITNRRNGRKVVVTVIDRGPGHKGRIIDLSPVAAAQLGMQRKGLAPVEIRRPQFE